MAAAFLLLLLLLLLLLAPSPSVTQRVSDPRRDGGRNVQQLWCVAKNNAEDDALRAAIDWACGPGATDCSPIQPGGACYDADDILSLASFAFNSYYLKSGMSQDSCDFGRSATLTSLNPSHGNCVFRSSTIAMNASYSGSSSSTSSVYDMDDANTKLPIWWQLPLSVLVLALTR